MAARVKLPKLWRWGNGYGKQRGLDACTSAPAQDVIDTNYVYPWGDIKKIRLIKWWEAIS